MLTAMRMRGLRSPSYSRSCSSVKSRLLILGRAEASTPWAASGPSRLAHRRYTATHTAATATSSPTFSNIPPRPSPSDSSAAPCPPLASAGPLQVSPSSAILHAPAAASTDRGREHTRWGSPRLLCYIVFSVKTDPSAPLGSSDMGEEPTSARGLTQEGDRFCSSPVRRVNTSGFRIWYLHTSLVPGWWFKSLIYYLLCGMHIGTEHQQVDEDITRKMNNNRDTQTCKKKQQLRDEEDKYKTLHSYKTMKQKHNMTTKTLKRWDMTTKTKNNCFKFLLSFAILYVWYTQEQQGDTKKHTFIDI